MSSHDVDPAQIFQLSTQSTDKVELDVKHESDQPSKKKRKAWGQPVPEIVPILPPRKRAKTAEEKEQRKVERIVRNRRAADKSRQRQKAAVAELEITKKQMEQENAQLRALVDQYRSRFGELADSGFNFAASTPTPSTLQLPIKTEPTDAYSTDTPMSYHTEFEASTVVGSPSMAPDSPSHLDDKISPSLAPTLLISNGQTFPELQQQEQLVMGDFGYNFSSLTQYPAAILCDLQCQLETVMSKSPKAKRPSPDFWNLIQTLHNLMVMMIFDNCSSTTHSPISLIFHIFPLIWSTISLGQDLPSFLDNHFILLHYLISTPTTAATQPTAVFRMKLLSRFLACSPNMARLLLAATNRELQRVVEQEAYTEDAEARALWASLLTMKWAISRLEKEHERYRQSIKNETQDRGQLDGVDYDAVEKTSGRWENIKFKGESELYEYNACTTGLEVH